MFDIISYLHVYPVVYQLGSSRADIITPQFRKVSPSLLHLTVLNSSGYGSSDHSVLGSCVASVHVRNCHGRSVPCFGGVLFTS